MFTVRDSDWTSTVVFRHQLPDFPRLATTKCYHPAICSGPINSNVTIKITFKRRRILVGITFSAVNSRWHGTRTHVSPHFHHSKRTGERNSFKLGMRIEEIRNSETPPEALSAGYHISFYLAFYKCMCIVFQRTLVRLFLRLEKQYKIDKIISFNTSDQCTIRLDKPRGESQTLTRLRMKFAYTLVVDFEQFPKIRLDSTKMVNIYAKNLSSSGLPPRES